MKSYISHRLLIIDEHVKFDDPILIRCMQLAFEWANSMGLQGKKVHSLTIINPDPNQSCLLQNNQTVWCKIECEEEQNPFPNNELIS